MMEKAVAFFAPKSRVDFAVKWLLLMIGINLLNYAIEGALYGFDVYPLAEKIGIIGLVGGPFVVLCLAMLAHQRQLQVKLVALAATDVLTGLYNRRAFFSHATAAHAAGDGGALLLLDADHFKRINDTYGHDVGDLCLRQIAAHLRSMVRRDDIVGRLGGEEFAIYLRNSSAERARAVGERICQGFNLDEADPPVRLRLTLSAGAVLAKAGHSIEQGLSVADRALYLAKQAGRARVIFAPH